MSPLWVSYRSMTSRFPPFAFVELVSPHNKKNITRWLEDMNFMLSWQEQYLTSELHSLVRYCSCHSNIKCISSCHCVISSMYYAWRDDAGFLNTWFLLSITCTEECLSWPSKVIKICTIKRCCETNLCHTLRRTWSVWEVFWPHG